MLRKISSISPTFRLGRKLDKKKSKHLVWTLSRTSGFDSSILKLLFFNFIFCPLHRSGYCPSNTNLLKSQNWQVSILSQGNSSVDPKAVFLRKFSVQRFSKFSIFVPAGNQVTVGNAVGNGTSVLCPALRIICIMGVPAGSNQRLASIALGAVYVYKKRESVPILGVRPYSCSCSIS